MVGRARSDVPVPPDAPPDPPPGYREPTRLGYSPWRVFVAGHLLLLAAVVVFGGALWAVRGPGALGILLDVVVAPRGGSFGFDLDRLAGLVLVGLVVTVLVHEALHGIAYRALGYEVSYGVSARAGAFYAAAFHQSRTAEEDVRVALSPVVVITLAATPLLFVPIPAVAITALVSLVFNTAGSVGDLLFVGRVLSMPEGTLLYDSDPRHAYAFEPIPETASRTSPAAEA